MSYCKASKREDFSIKLSDDSDKRVIDAENLIKKRIKETEELFEMKNPNLNDIIGNDDVKNIIIRRLVNYIEHKSKLVDLKKYPSSGIILAGVQGTGKTEIVYASVNNIVISNKKYREQFDVIIMKSHDFMSGSVGESGKKIEAILDTLRKSNKENNKETILIIDEIDNLVPDRETRSVLTSERTGSILDEFGGGHDNHTIFLMGTTNKPYRIDAEALVAGRFGNPILVNISSNEEKVKLFTKFTSNMNLEKELINEEFISENFSRFSGRDIKSFTTDLQVIFFEKIKKGEHNSEPIITKDDVRKLLESPSYRNTNELNLQMLNRLGSYYGNYDEEVVGSTISSNNEIVMNKFIREYLDVNLEDNSKEFISDIYNGFENFKEYNGMKRQVFTRLLKKKLLKIDKVSLFHPIGEDGKQHDAFLNVKLKNLLLKEEVNG